MVKQQTDPDAVHPEPLLTSSEAAHRLHISRSLLYKLIREGLLPVIQLGGTLRFRPEDVDELGAPKAIAARRRAQRKKGAS